MSAAEGRTPTGIPVTDCDTCQRRHPVTRRHCEGCGLALIFPHGCACPTCLHPLDSAEHHAECVAPLDQVAGGEG